MVNAEIGVYRLRKGEENERVHLGFGKTENNPQIVHYYYKYFA